MTVVGTPYYMSPEVFMQHGSEYYRKVQDRVNIAWRFIFLRKQSGSVSAVGSFSPSGPKTKRPYRNLVHRIYSISASRYTVCAIVCFLENSDPLKFVLLLQRSAI